MESQKGCELNIPTEFKILSNDKIQTPFRGMENCSLFHRSQVIEDFAPMFKDAIKQKA
jgi:hypothetical protein